MKKLLQNQIGLRNEQSLWRLPFLHTTLAKVFSATSSGVIMAVFAFMVALSVSTSANAQVTIGNGTSSTTFTPIYSCYGYSYTEQIYQQSEIGVSGNITSVSFYINSLPSSTANSVNWTIYLGHTTQSDYASTTSWVGANNMTQVYTGTVTYPAAGNWITINLTTPFAYNNTSNLVVAAYENTPGWDCSVNFAYTPTTGSNSSIYFRSDATNPNPLAPPTATGTTVNRANVQFGGITQACPAPTGFAAANVTATGADLSWTSGSGLSNVEYGPAGFTPGTGTTLTGVTSPQVLTGLSAATAYDVYIIDDCGASGVSIPLTGGFNTLIQGPVGVTCTTPGANPAVVFTDDFETSAGWTGNIGSGVNNWIYDASGTPSSGTGPLSAYSGSQYVFVETSGAAVGTPVSLVSPAIDLSAGNDAAELSFWVHAFGAQIGTLNVGVSTSATGPFTNLWTYSGAIQTAQADPFQNVGVNLDAYVGQTIYIEFLYTTNGSFEGDIALDLVEVSSCLSCVLPSAPLATVLSDTSAEVTWTPGLNETAWDVQWGPTGFVPGTGDSIVMGTNPDTITGLMPNTTYDYYVRANCGGTSGVSAWVGPTTFTTLCASQLSGTVTIDAGQPASATNFQSFAALANEINACGISGALTVNVAAGTYNEQVTFTDIVGASATNTITIDGGGVATISYDGAGTENATITLDGTDHITIQNLTIENTESVSNGWGVLLTNTADNVTIDNCVINIDMTSTSSTFAGVLSSNSTTSLFSYANNSNYTTISNTTINGGYYGVRLNGSSSTAADNTGNTIENCTFNENRFYPIYFFYQDAPVARGNTTNLRAGVTSGYGIYVGSSKHPVVEGNYFNGAYTYGIFFTTVNSTTQNPTMRGVIANNMVTALSSGDGIYLSSADQVDIFHNTVTAENDQALWINSTSNDYDVRNNVFSASGSSQVVDLDAAPAATDVLNYNVYYHSGGGDIAIVGSSTYATLAAWQGADAVQNINSLEGDPVFASPTDLHLLGPLANNAGDNTVGITIDIDGDTRPAAGATTVDIGADEFTAVTGDLAMLAGMVQQSACYSTNDTAIFYVQNVIGGTVDFSIDSLVLNWAVTGPLSSLNSSGSITVNSGTLAAGDTLMISVSGVNQSAAGNYVLNAYIDPNGANQSDVNDTLGAVPFAKSSLLTATPAMAMITSTSDTVELAAFSPFFPNAGFFITEVCQFGNGGTGQANPYPSYMTGTDDYIEITGAPFSDFSGYTIEQWSSSGLIGSYTFPSGSSLNSMGTAVIRMGVSGTDDPINAQYFAPSAGTNSSGTGSGRVFKNGLGTIVDAVGYSGSTSTAYTFPAASGVSATDWSNSILGGSGTAGIRLEGADVNSGTNWVLVSATNTQDPNQVNNMVTVPAAPPVTGFSWNLDGNSIATSTTTTIGPWMANNNGTYKYVAAYNSADCGMVYDTATVVVNIPCGDTVVAPFFDGFETGNTYSACWTQDQVTGTNSWTFATGSSGGSVNTAKTGSLNARFTSSNGGPHITRLISPFIDASALTAPQLEFAYAQEVWFGDQNFLNVYYRDSANGAWNVVFSDSTNKASWTDVIVSVPSSSSTLQIAFEGVDNWGRAVVVDDVTLMETPTCPAPVALGGFATTSTTATVYWSSTAPSFQIEYDTAGFTPGMGSMMVVANDTANLTGLMADMNYEFYVRAICTPGDTSFWAGPGTFFTGYCTPAPISVDGQGITNVTMGGINNTTGAEPGNYGDYTNLVAMSSPGATMPIDITLATGFTYNLWVWVDWNDDLDFNDPNEEFYLGNSTNANPTTFNGSIAIPATAPFGNHRIRIGGADVGLGSTPPSDPCYTGSWGAFEDYTLNVMLMQVDLPITFDDNTVNYDPISFGGAIDSIITDPTDPNNMVLRQDKPTGAQTWAGTTIGGSGLANPVPFAAGSTYMNARVWSPDSGTAVLLKVENVSNGALSVETIAYTTAAATWETLNFDFSNHSPNTPPLNLTTVYDKVSVFCDFNTAGSGKTFYVDDIQFGAFQAQVDLPITFDDPLINYDPISFGSAIDSIITDPTDPNNLVLRQDKPVGAATWAGTTIGGSGIANPVPFAAGSTYMNARVWSPDSGTAVLLKVENVSNGALSVETIAYTTAAATWQTLNFDFSNHSPNTPPLNLSTVYDKVSVFCDFNTAGSGKTFYVDDIQFGQAQQPLAPFNLVSPPDMTTLLVVGPAQNTVAATWESASASATYEWRAYLPGGSVNAPLVALPSDNAGADTTITFTIGQLDALLASLNVNIGDTATIMWNVRATNGTDTIFGTTPFELSLVRLGTSAPNVVAAPVGGTGTTGLSGPNGTTATYFRAATIVTGAEYAAANIASGDAFRSIGLSLNAPASGNVQGIMKVYLLNTADATYSKGNIWDTITSDMVQVFNDTVNIAAGASGYNMTLSTNFNYAGNNVYVAYDWEQLSAPLTTGLVYRANTLIASSIRRQASSVAPPATLTGTSSFRLEMLWGIDKPADDLGVTALYAKGKNPLNYGAPETIQVVVANNGYLPANKMVTLNISGANTFSANAMVNLPSETDTVLEFTFTAANTGFNTIVASVPADDIAGNNASTWVQSSTSNTFSYADTNETNLGGVGYNTGSGLLLDRHELTGTASVTDVNIRIADNAASAGNTVYAVVLDTAGNIVGQSANLVLTAGNVNSWVSFTIPQQPTFTNEPFFVGLAQTANALTGYFPMAFQTEDPTRDNAYFTADLVGTNLGAIGGFRFMIEAVVDTPATCPDPANLAVMANCTDADITWDSDTSATSTIQWGPAGFTPGSGNFVYNASSPYNLSGLTLGTSYDVWVLDTCALGSVSNWVGPVTFTTDTLPVVSGSANLVSSGTVVTYDFTATGTGTSYAWDFGDGNSGTGANTSHDYTANGTYTVVVTATNNCGSSYDTLTALVEGIGLDEFGFGSVDLYPNPNNGYFTISGISEFGSDATIDVISVTGAIVYTEKVVANGAESFNIDLRGFAPGLYQVRISSEKGVSSKPFVLRN